MSMKKVLVVDDDASILDAVSLVLEEGGYDVRAIVKGNETVKEASRYRPDVVLLDVLMSGTDGREICKAMKKDTTLKDTPVVMMSAHPTAKHSVVSSGADAFLPKPFDMKSLLDMVSAYTNS